MELKLCKPVESEIIFHSDSNNWIMKLTKNGIIFNREKFSEYNPDDFALAVIQILETSYKVKFEKNEPPYNRD